MKDLIQLVLLIMNYFQEHLKTTGSNFIRIGFEEVFVLFAIFIFLFVFILVTK